jgi:hypothetical protein
MNVSIKIPEDIVKLLNEVKSNVRGYDVYLGGGLLRDQHCDLEFKDVDIFLVPNEDKRDLIPYTPRGFAISYTKNCEAHEDMRERGVEALIGLYERKQDEYGEERSLQVQYIIYEKYISIEDLASDMDMTLNQVMWEPVPQEEDQLEFECHCTDDFLDAHKRGWIEFTHEYDEVRMYCRQKRMIEKFPSYTVLDEVELDQEQKQTLAENGEREYDGSA